jgi:integrase
MSIRTPKYRLHRGTGLAVVSLGGRDIYLGRHGLVESRPEYDRLIAEWLSNGRQVKTSSDATISELINDYLQFADGYYRRPDGSATSEVANLEAALGPLRRLYGHTLAQDFGPPALQAVREEFVQAGLCRRTVNARTQRVVRFFAWCVANERIPGTVLHALKALPGLRAGRTPAPERPPVRPAPAAYVEAALRHVSPPVKAILELMRLTGMRPCETCQMRTCYSYKSDRVWIYRPGLHKT